MERTTSLKEAKKILKRNFIGPDELAKISRLLGIIVPTKIPPIPFKPDYLRARSGHYLLILGLARTGGHQALNLASLRKRFGTNPLKAEPCFYNQDWYQKERFMKRTLKSGWHLIRLDLFPDSRAQVPEKLSARLKFPSAVLCAYAFFAYWFYNKKKLWPADFVWCDDFDHNGDRIYVGRYRDPSGNNKNGFNIHRHLKLRPNYGSIDVL